MQNISNYQENQTQTQEDKCWHGKKCSG